MKFSFKFEITDNRRESEGAERTGTGSRILGELAKGAGAAKDALKKHLPKLGRLADSISDEIKTDVAAVRDRDPAARNDVEVLLLYSGVHAILAYRVAHKLYLGKKYFSARAVSQLAKFITGIEIHPGAKIGKGLVIDHGTGVVIGETAEIGDNCTLYQGVTLRRTGIEIHPGATIGRCLFIDHGMGIVFGETAEIGDNCTIYHGVTLGGTGKDTGKRHPTLGNNVMIGAGAKVLGPFRIGDNAKIAAGAVVLEEIPANATAVGIPARVVRRDGVRVTGCNEELDQVHLPDPVAQQFCRLETRTEKLEAELEALRAAMKKEADGSAGTPPTGDQ